MFLATALQALDFVTSNAMAFCWISACSLVYKLQCAFMYKAIKPDGYMVIDLHNPEKDIYTLVSNMNPEVWIKKKYMIVKVRLIKGAKSTSPIVKGE